MYSLRGGERGFMKNQCILIAGPKHSGKSKAACALGKITGAETADLDELVERQTGKKVRALFREDPEVFMQAEARALGSLVQTAKSETLRIIAAGGGLIDNPQAMALLLQHKEISIVYLDVSPETAWRRIGAAGELPPFLDTENPGETHLALHKRRATAYKALAHFTVYAENKSAEEIALEIVEFLNLTRR